MMVLWQVIRLLLLPFATSSATRQGHLSDKEHRARAILSKVEVGG